MYNFFSLNRLQEMERRQREKKREVIHFEGMKPISNLY